jgi:hypothetical protein
MPAVANFDGAWTVAPSSTSMPALMVLDDCRRGRVQPAEQIMSPSMRPRMVASRACSFMGYSVLLDGQAAAADDFAADATENARSVSNLPSKGSCHMTPVGDGQRGASRFRAIVIGSWGWVTSSDIVL